MITKAEKTELLALLDKLTRCDMGELLDLFPDTYDIIGEEPYEIIYALRDDLRDDLNIEEDRC